MPGFANQPKVLRGAFVEFGDPRSPLVVVFQFNPATISRGRSATVGSPETPAGSKAIQNPGLPRPAPDKSPLDVRRGQVIKVGSESLSFDIRLDATDRLERGYPVAARAGVVPQLATLELMMLPKEKGGRFGAAAALLGGPAQGFAFADEAKNPPAILFVWGRKNVLPVNITKMQIKEEEFSPDLSPTRVTVSVSLEVIETASAPFLYSRALKEAMSLLDYANPDNLPNAHLPR